jgi:hypothetical protein
VGFVDIQEINLEDADKTFYLRYGHALAAWAGLERSVADMFARIHSLPRDRAHAIFFSANSWSGRARMASASIPFAKTIPAGKTFLADAIKLANTYSLTRNALAHDRHQLYLDADAPKVERRITPHVSGPEITLEQMQMAGVNFAYLGQIIELSFGRQTLLREPELSLALLRLMPGDPVSQIVDLNAANPLGKELAQHRG